MAKERKSKAHCMKMEEQKLLSFLYKQHTEAGDGANFKALTWQELVKALAPSSGKHNFALGCSGLPWT
jgi:hypothetical protein